MRDKPDHKDRLFPPASPFEEELVFPEQETLRVRQGLEFRMRGLADESPFLQAFVEERPIDMPMDGETAAPAFTEDEDLTAEFEAEEDWQATAPWQPEYEPEMETEADEAETPEVIDQADEFGAEEFYAEEESADWQDAEDGEVDWEEGEGNDEVTAIEAENSFETYQLPCDDLERIPTDYEGEFEELFDEESGIRPDDKRIDVRAKFALPKMLKRPDMQADAQRLIAGINSGQLAGIFGNDLGIAVKVAKTHNRNRFQLIPKGDDGSLVLNAAGPLNAPPMVFFRGDDPDISKQPQRFYTALQKASQTFKLWQGKLMGPCTAGSSEGIKNLVPEGYCIEILYPVQPEQREPIHRIIYGWDRYRRKVEELPPAQQVELKKIGDIIIDSHQIGRNPVRTVYVCGHADLDTPPNPQREQQMSDKRAHMVFQWLRRYVGETIDSRITWFERGLGAARLKASPTSEENRRKNRRVEVYLDAKDNEVCSAPPKTTPPNPSMGSILVRVVHTDGTPARKVLVYLYSNPPYVVNDDGEETDTEGKANFGKRKPGRYKVIASHNRYYSTGEFITVTRGKASVVTLTLRSANQGPRCEWAERVQWDEKFDRIFKEGCSYHHLIRTFCGFGTGVDSPPQNVLIALAKLSGAVRLLLPDVCRMSVSELELRVDDFVRSQVLYEVQREIDPDFIVIPGPGWHHCNPSRQIAERYAEWKRRTGRRCMR